VLVATIVASVGIASCRDVSESGREIAQVNGQVITYGELVEELERRQGVIALLDLVDETVIRQEAGRRGIAISDQERQAGLERAAARSGSMADLRAKLKQSGIAMQTYQHNIETDLLLDRIARQEVKVADEDIAEYYRARRAEFERGPRVRARIMLFLDKASAETVAEVLEDPQADFAGLAESLSEDDATRAKGGDTGYFEREDYATSIADAAFSLQPGETSGIIKAPDGWVILRVEDTKPAGPMALEEVRDRIKQRIVREKLQKARSSWLVQARKRAELWIGDPRLRSGVMQRLQTVKPPPLPGQI